MEIYTSMKYVQGCGHHGCGRHKCQYLTSDQIVERDDRVKEFANRPIATQQKIIRKRGPSKSRARIYANIFTGADGVHGTYPTGGARAYRRGRILKTDLPKYGWTPAQIAALP